jgi:lysophospholipase L1-like esterase
MRYVAVGDSFTEGVGDWREDGTPRGWADRVAEGLAAHEEDFQYANLAIRGRLLIPIATTQVDAALALDPLPTLLTFNGGGNDMLRPGHNTAVQMMLIRSAMIRCLRAGVQPVLLSGPDPSAGLPMGKTFHERGTALTLAAKRLTEDLGILFVNAFQEPDLQQAQYWSEDRLHLNPHGHARVAHMVLTTLGVRSTLDPAPERKPWRQGMTSEALYYREHVAPWIGRRIRKTSSGNGREPKHPTWSQLD